jgi:ectoine hydroxylase-related dioxygenase (phytanoyl-CoA dioxygenase family)
MTIMKMDMFLKKNTINADKLISFKDAISNLIKHDNRASLIESLRHLEKTNKNLFYKTCTESIWYSVAGLALITDEKLTTIAGEILKTNPGNLTPVGHAIFWNDPQCKRLQYKWHQESSYYPNTKNVVSVWFPLLFDIKLESGPMVIAKGSHNNKLDFNKVSKVNHVTQLITDEDIVNKFEHIPCTMDLGDAVFFHQNTIHKTGENTTNIPRVSGIIRYANLTNEESKTSYWKINPEF